MRAKNSLRVFERLRTNIAILKKTVQEEGNDYNPKTNRTNLFLVELHKYCGKLLELIKKETEILELEVLYKNEEAHKGEEKERRKLKIKI